MREIKFRAYNKKHKVYYYSHSARKEKRLTQNQKLKIFFDVISEYSDEFEEPEQYTGLKDENGVEIYEGDIVETESCIALVNFTICEFGLRIKSSFMDLTTWHSLEVIGNIHENPELMETK